MALGYPFTAYRLRIASAVACNFAQAEKILELKQVYGPDLLVREPIIANEIDLPDSLMNTFFAVMVD